MRNTVTRLHVTPSATPHVDAARFDTMVTVHRAEGDVTEPHATPIAVDELGREWEWEETPEVSVCVVDDVGGAVALFNELSPRLAASLVSDDSAEHDRFWAAIDAPFVGNGFTRWVDGQWAWQRPELGLTNWEQGRLLGRSGFLSGDDLTSVRDVFIDETGRAEQRR